MATPPTSSPIFDSADESIYTLKTTAAGPSGRLPFAPEQLRDEPSGNLFGWTQDVGMGWSPEKLGGAEFLILSTAGGMRRDDGSPIALGFHTGHWEVGLLVEEASKVLAAHGAVPFAAACRPIGTPPQRVRILTLSVKRASRRSSLLT